MKIFLIALISVLIAFFYTGCSSKKRVVAPVKILPTWYAQPRQSDARVLYSVGEGEDKAEALANALSTMLSTLSVSVESTFSTQSSVSQGAVERIQTDSLSEVYTAVKKVRISNYEVFHTKEYGFQRYLIAIKSNKKKIFSSLLKEIEQKFDTIEINYAESLKYNSLKKLLLYKKAKIDTDSLPHTLLVMNVLDPSFNDKPYLQKILEIQSRYDSLLSKITFSIHPNAKAKVLVPVIAKGLSLQKYKLGKKMQGRNHFRIYISSSIAQAKSFGFNLARTAISVQVKDYQGLVLASNKFNITGQSTQGYEIAKENVAIKLNNMITKDGIAKIIALEL